MRKRIVYAKPGTPSGSVDRAIQRAQGKNVPEPEVEYEEVHYEDCYVPKQPQNAHKDYQPTTMDVNCGHCIKKWGPSP